MPLVGDSAAKITTFSVTSARSKATNEQTARASRRINWIACRVLVERGFECQGKRENLQLDRRSGGFLESEEPLDPARKWEVGAGVFERTRGDAWNLKGETGCNELSNRGLAPVTFVCRREINFWDRETNLKTRYFACSNSFTFYQHIHLCPSNMPIYQRTRFLMIPTLVDIFHDCIVYVVRNILEFHWHGYGKYLNNRSSIMLIIMLITIRRLFYA